MLLKYLHTTIYKPKSLKFIFRAISSTVKLDPQRFIRGMTEDQFENNPALVEYVRANFPQVFEEEGAADADIPYGGLYQDHVERKKEKEPKLEEPSYPRNIRPLSSYLRDSMSEDGSRRCREMRYFKMIPGLLYGSDPTKNILSNQPDTKIFIKTPWPILERELERYHRNFESRVYNLTIFKNEEDTEGTVHQVIPQNVQRHPVKSTIFCANFCRYHADRPIEFPLKNINEEESPALKREGFIIPIKRKVECFVEEGADIPESLELECTGLRLKEVIRLDRLVLPPGVRLSKRVVKQKHDFILGVVFGRGRGGDGDTTEETEKKGK